VHYEAERPFIIKAKDMRGDIEARVASVPGIFPMFVDEGAFRVALRWCFDRNPDCLHCPLQKLCLAGQGSDEHRRWTAYQQ
jgi:hypothetical protein